MVFGAPVTKGHRGRRKNMKYCVNYIRKGRAFAAGEALNPALRLLVGSAQPPHPDFPTGLRFTHPTPRG